MDKLLNYYRKVELFFGTVKFAVVIIVLFAAALAWGTFMESYHGTEYANRLIYKAFWFMAIQFFMFLSIVFATLIRLPPKKHLYGFYTIHAGLITIFLGSFVTYQAGVDGTMTLGPNSPSRSIMLSDDEFRIQIPGQGKEITLALPFVAGAKDLKTEYEGIKLKNFYPFSKNELRWMPTKINAEGRSSSRYRLYNENFGEFITLSLHPESDFNNTTQLGLLNVHYMPAKLADCFMANTPDGLIIWNGETADCIAPGAQELRKVKGPTGNQIVELKFNGEKLSFIPSMSPLPLNQNMELNELSQYRAFSKKLFEANPHLFTFGKKIAFYNKETKLWEGAQFEGDKPVSIPWMGFKLILLDHFEDAFPMLMPVSLKPIQENGAVTVGDMKAVEVEVDGKTFWVKSGEPVAFNRMGDKIRFEIGKKMLTLPYEIVLDQFKMDTDPGTNNPASYESFITLFKGVEGSEKHHVFMNNPLKYNNFTFYQASYFQTQEGPFGSVLSVNFDPGRPWKYLGSLLLVLGSIWHYFLRRKHLAKPGAAHA